MQETSYSTSVLMPSDTNEMRYQLASLLQGQQSRALLAHRRQQQQRRKKSCRAPGRHNALVPAKSRQSWSQRKPPLTRCCRSCWLERRTFPRLPSSKKMTMTKNDDPHRICKLLCMLAERRSGVQRDCDCCGCRSPDSFSLTDPASAKTESTMLVVQGDGVMAGVLSALLSLICQRLPHPTEDPVQKAAQATLSTES